MDEVVSRNRGHLNFNLPNLAPRVFQTSPNNASRRERNVMLSLSAAISPHDYPRHHSSSWHMCTEHRIQ